MGKRRAAAKSLIRELCGFAPYEKRIMELLRNSLDKRALRCAKRKVRRYSYMARDHITKKERTQSSIFSSDASTSSERSRLRLHVLLRA